MNSANVYARNDTNELPRGGEIFKATRPTNGVYYSVTALIMIASAILSYLPRPDGKRGAQVASALLQLTQARFKLSALWNEYELVDTDQKVWPPSPCNDDVSKDVYRGFTFPHNGRDYEKEETWVAAPINFSWKG